jgi:D-aminopeptidase
VTDTGSLPGPHAATPAGKPRARSLGIPFGGTPGTWNAITDVTGVEVGYATLIEGESVRTGVTGILPRGPAGAADPVAAGFFSLNGNGEMTGVSWIAESGTLSLPIAITNTHAVGIAHAGIVAWTAKHHPELGDEWSLPVAAETWDGYLNDAYGHHVTEATVIAALEAARSGPIEEGSVGGGTGMICYEFKGGNGTASRVVEYAGTTYTVGVFLQANFGSREQLTLAGLPLGELLAGDGRLRRAIRRWLGHRHRGHRRSAAAAPVHRAGPPGRPRPRPHRHHRLALLRRPVPRVLGRQPGRVQRLPPGR